VSALSTPRAKRLTLAACIIGSGIAILDGTVVNVALPTIQRELGGGLAGQQWVSNAYLLTLCSLILVGGSLGDLYGERRIFALGVGGFGLASLLCALAPTIGFLIAFRALQGVAGALLIPSSLAVIVATFPAGRRGEFGGVEESAGPEGLRGAGKSGGAGESDGPKESAGPGESAREESERGAAIGTWTAFGAIAAAVGPLGGGLLLGVGSWRLIFLINLPFVCACVALILFAVPRAAPREVGRAIDLTGALLCALGLAGPVFALIEQPRLGWSSAAVLVPLCAGVLLFVVFLAYESRTRDPMLPLELFSRRNFAVGNVETFAMYAGLALLFFLLVLFLQQVAGFSPLQSGLATSPVTVVMLVLSRRFGALADRHGPRLFMGGGPCIAGIGLLALLRVGVHVDYLTEVLPALLLFALGLSITVAPLTAAVLAGVEERRAGIASGVNNALARVAGLIAVAALGAIVAVQFSATLDRHLAGVPLSGRAAAAVAQAKRLVLGRPSVVGLAPSQGRAIVAASDAASLRSFRVGISIAGGLVLLGGAIGAAGIQNPRRLVSAEECPGGALVGASPDAAGLHEGTPAAGAPTREGAVA
jgi:MFS family permease